MSFTLIAEDQASKARAGTLQTAHVEIQTPIFMPVGTIGSVKTVPQQMLKNDINAPIILGNTYHLYLRPGMEIIEAAGGLHKFMNWNRAILTDSGGYQVYSLAQRRKIQADGVWFNSHIDGSKHFFTPEKVVDIQRSIGSDIMMVLDECPPYPCDYNYAKTSLELTKNWAISAKKHFNYTSGKYGHEQLLFPIVQGGTYKDLRIDSAKFTADLDLPGNAIGGLSVGEPTELMYEMTDLCTDHLPKNKPRYLMGVGTPENLLENITLGVDMFDCVLPTRNARHGLLYTWNGVMHIKNAKFKDDFSPIDNSSDLEFDNYYSKAYLRHLFKAQELLAMQIASVHNLHFFLKLVRTAREKIIDGTFFDWKKATVEKITQKI